MWSAYPANQEVSMEPNYVPGLLGNAEPKALSSNRFSMAFYQLMILLLAAGLLSIFPAAAAGQEELLDVDIARAVEASLMMSSDVSAHLIDVSVEDGIVTLAGSVDNILARDSAVEAAQTVRGVRSVIDMIEVRVSKRPDIEIWRDVKAALLIDPATDSYEVDASVTDGHVTLTGTVESWAEMRLVEEVVKSVEGVKEVTNDIELDFETDRPDSEIKAEVEARLESDGYVYDGLINVSVEDGVVKLSGSVGSATERMYALGDAWVTGVKDVDIGELEVKWWLREEMRRESKYADRTDEEVAANIKDALIYDPRVSSFDVDVEVKNGVATLTGIVDNLKAKKSAERDAENTIGAWRVENYIRVRPQERPQDVELAEKIRRALFWNPFVKRYDISVEVINGKAYLDGIVDSYSEKMYAQDIASRVNGVVEVENRIEIRPPQVRKSDWYIEQEIERSLNWDALVDASKITVSVENGVATVSGEVDTRQQLAGIVRTALEAGAEYVESKIFIRNAPREYIDQHFGRYYYPIQFE
jgi:osmotically-inducible protein OsmY